MTDLIDHNRNVYPEVTPDAIADAIEAADLTGMSDPGDTVELPGGFTLKLWLEPDQDTTINDFDCYGRVEWVHYRDGHAQRPATMDGAARKLETDYPYVLWWQPRDEIKGDPEAIEAEASYVADIVRYGYTIVGLELLAPSERVGRPWVNTVSTGDGVALHDAILPLVANQCLGGVETVSLWHPSGHLTQVLAELASEMAWDLRQAVASQ